MRSLRGLLSFFVAGVVLFYSTGTYARREANMIEFFEKRYITKVCVEEVTNSSGDRAIDTAVVKGNIEQALLDRKSHRFEIVETEAEADIVVKMDITEYFFTTEDPVDMIVSPLAIAIDKMKKDHYARMQARVTVVDAKTGRELWKRSIKSTITDATMSEEESYERSQERIVKILVRRLFSKKRRGRR